MSRVFYRLQAIAVCDSSGVKQELIGGRGDQENTCNQSFCGLDTLDLQLESWSRERAISYEQDLSRAYPKHIDCKFVHQSGNPTPTVSKESLPTG
ncbi:hypothetical protein TNCV_4005241 [Trichonephila clavipes]|nr:hypothetical protein TNCV_4005241 [Trichonephila clavipes]